MGEAGCPIERASRPLRQVSVLGAHLKAVAAS